MSATTKVHHPIFARFYQRFAAAGEAKGAAELRRELMEGLSGRVIEVGAGHGLNFRYYPQTVTEVVAVEPEAVLRRAAEKAATTAPIPVRVLDGVADALPVEDGAFDVGVASLVLCSIANQDAALRELHRVIRPGGELRFFEHVVANQRGFARAQRIADPLRTRLAGGCHLTRDTALAIERAGFSMDELRRFSFHTSVLDRLAAPIILGRALRS